MIINGFTEEQIRNQNKKSVGELVREFLEWGEKCQNKTLAGINPWFDRDFLIESSKIYEIKWPLGYRTIDLYTLVYTHHLKRSIEIPLRKARTDIDSEKIFNYVGLPAEPRPHHALTGAKMEAETFSRLIYGKSLFEEFEKFEIPAYLGR